MSGRAIECFRGVEKTYELVSLSGSSTLPIGIVRLELVMSVDGYQMNNLLAGIQDISDASQDENVCGWPLRQVAGRRDALMMVLKSCEGDECTHPWLQLHPQGNVKTLQDALDWRYDSFYANQPKVAFSACKLGYLVEFEGPQTAMKYSED